MGGWTIFSTTIEICIVVSFNLSNYSTSQVEEPQVQYLWQERPSPPLPRVLPTYLCSIDERGAKKALWEAAAKSSSLDSSTSQKSLHKKRPEKSKSKLKGSARKTTAIKDFKKQQQKQFVQFMKYMNDGGTDTNSGSNSSDTVPTTEVSTALPTLLFPPPIPGVGGSHRSAKNSRSGKVSHRSLFFDDSKDSVTQSDPDTDLDGFTQTWMEVKCKQISSRHKQVFCFVLTHLFQ